jgi:hypothetical protein
MDPTGQPCAGHPAQKDEAVGGRHAVGEAPVRLELPDAVFVVETVDAPAEAIHRLHQFTEPAHVVHDASDVVRWLAQARSPDRRGPHGTKR